MGKEEEREGYRERGEKERKNRWREGRNGRAGQRDQAFFVQFR